MPIFEHEHTTRSKQNINIRLSNYANEYGPKGVFYMGLKLFCISFDINISNFF